MFPSKDLKILQTISKQSMAIPWRISAADTRRTLCEGASFIAGRVAVCGSKVRFSNTRYYRPGSPSSRRAKLKCHMLPHTRTRAKQDGRLRRLLGAATLPASVAALPPTQCTRPYTTIRTLYLHAQHDEVRKPFIRIDVQTNQVGKTARSQAWQLRCYNTVKKCNLCRESQKRGSQIVSRRNTLKRRMYAHATLPVQNKNRQWSQRPLVLYNAQCRLDYFYTWLSVGLAAKNSTSDKWMEFGKYSQLTATQSKTSNRNLNRHKQESWLARLLQAFVCLKDFHTKGRHGLVIGACRNNTSIDVTG